MHYEKKINGPCAQSIMLLVKNLLNYHQVDEYGTAWYPNWDLNIEMLAHIQNHLLDILSIFKCKSITPFLEYK